MCPMREFSNAEVASFPIEVTLVGVVCYCERSVIGIVCIDKGPDLSLCSQDGPAKFEPGYGLIENGEDEKSAGAWDSPSTRLTQDRAIGGSRQVGYAVW